MTPDPQRRRVDIMERRVFRGHLDHKAPLREIRAAVNAACRLHGVPPVTVSIRRCHAAGGWYDPDGKFIFLDRGEQCLLSAAHELAHHITAHRHPHAQDHGPAWMRWYAHLLDAWRLVPIEGTLAACRRYGIAVAPVIRSDPNVNVGAALHVKETRRQR